MKYLLTSCLFALILFSVLFIPLAAAQVIEQHDIKVVVDKKMSILDVQIKMTLNKVSKQGMAFSLNNSATELNITNNGKKVEYQFDKTKKPNIYFDGGLLTVDSEKLSVGSTISFHYKLDIASINYWTPDNLSAGFTSKNGFEIGMYSAWLPTELSNGDFNYQLEIQVPNDYLVLGNGDISNVKDNIWIITSNSRQFDVPLIVSDRLESVAYTLGNIIIEVSHFGLPKLEVNELADDIKLILSLFNKQFGTSTLSGVVRFAFVPRNDVASYSRKGFSAINTARSGMGKFSTIAHEIGHFWWNGSDSSLWEDWLDESFAEFSALMAIKHRFGDSVFNKQLESYIEISKNSPAIWGIDRESDIATLVLYRKGPVIIEETRQKIGDEKFRKLLQTLISLEVKNTNNFLNELALIMNESELVWFEKQLHR